jgi:hypothetical protein
MAHGCETQVEYTITPSEDGDYIVITTVGDLTRESAAEISVAAFELGDRLGIRCYLNDVTRCRNVENVTENARFTLKDIPQFEPRDSDAVAAVLVDPADHTHDFYVALARSRGIDMTLFWDRDEAIRHLKAAAARFNADHSQ